MKLVVEIVAPSDHYTTRTFARLLRQVANSLEDGYDTATMGRLPEKSYVKWETIDVSE